MTASPFRGNFASYDLICLAENYANKRLIELTFTVWSRGARRSTARRCRLLSQRRLPAQSDDEENKLEWPLRFEIEESAKLVESKVKRV